MREKHRNGSDDEIRKRRLAVFPLMSVCTVIQIILWVTLFAVFLLRERD
jgi:hypothetical protein